MFKLLFSFLAVLHFSKAAAQDPIIITLETCQEATRQQYPLLKKKALISDASGNSVNAIYKALLPQAGIFAQVTNQSEVTKLPVKLPGIQIDEPGKTQYRAYGEISQLLYDGGKIRSQAAVVKMQYAIQQADVETALYQLRERVNAIYFGLLLLDQRKKQQDIVQKDISNGLAKLEAALLQGTIFRSQVDLVKAELLLAEQQGIELSSNYNMLLEELALLTGKALLPGTVLEEPAVPVEYASLSRPELQKFKLTDNLQDAKWMQLRSRNKPEVSAFLQGGGGQPALNMLVDKFQPYYIAGIKFRWNLGSNYSARNERAVINADKQISAINKEVFLFETKAALTRQSEEITKLRALLASDGAIIPLRSNIRMAALAQLENGVITGHDYLREVYAEDKARVQAFTHRLQLLAALYNQKHIRGN